ncbi:MAG: helix-turn-helix domain containing protein, partial [Eubacteriales bacterium]|nr:helix-turn-helix domain containing protein [Eubacteriales bacterium]
MVSTGTESRQKRKNGLATSRQIMEAAADLFARYGYDGVPVRRIAEAAGIKESSIYNHFSGKADLLTALYDNFIRRVPETRPSEEALDRMVSFMEPDEVFKAILFHVGESVSGTLANTAQIINYEKFKNARAAEIYYRYVVEEPAVYYEKLILKMRAAGKVGPVDAKMFAQQYNYISIALTKEYIMAQYGLADGHAVVAYMVRTLRFFC